MHLNFSLRLSDLLVWVGPRHSGFSESFLQDPKAQPGMGADDLVQLSYFIIKENESQTSEKTWDKWQSYLVGPLVNADLFV